MSLQLPRASENLTVLSNSHSLILGSSSTWRRKVLESAGVRIIDTQAPDIDEKAIRDSDPHALTLAIAQAKADALFERRFASNPASTVLICSDQVSVCCGEIREKPESESQARVFLKSYSNGNPVTTVTAIVLLDIATGRRVHGHHEAVVTFSPMPEEAIVRITRPESAVYTCCGGFSVDAPEMREFVKSIEGGVDSVMGMPLGLLERLLGELVSFHEKISA